eukprot:1161753-Pelagomonas_calceolata.AAC.1
MLGLIWRAYVSPLARAWCPFGTKTFSTKTFSNATAASAKQRQMHEHDELAATLQHAQHETYNWQWNGPHSPAPQRHGWENTAEAQAHSSVPSQRVQAHQAHQQSEPAAQLADPPGAITTCEQQAKAIGGYRTSVTTWPNGTGFKKTFYKRTLPSPPATAFASEEGRKLFAEALAAGHTNGFFKLMEQFRYKDSQNCGHGFTAGVLLKNKRWVCKKGRGALQQPVVIHQQIHYVYGPFFLECSDQPSWARSLLFYSGACMF